MKESLTIQTRVGSLAPSRVLEELRVAVATSKDVIGAKQAVEVLANRYAMAAWYEDLVLEAAILICAKMHSQA